MRFIEIARAGRAASALYDTTPDVVHRIMADRGSEDIYKAVVVKSSCCERRQRGHTAARGREGVDIKEG